MKTLNILFAIVAISVICSQAIGQPTGPGPHSYRNFPEDALRIDAHDYNIFVIGKSGKIYHDNLGSVTECNGNGRGLDVTCFKDTPYVIGTDNRIYKNDGKGWGEIPGNGFGKKIWCDKTNGTIWVIGTDDLVYYHDNVGWLRWGKEKKGKDIATDNNIPYIIGMDNKVYRTKPKVNGEVNEWEEITSNSIEHASITFTDNKMYTSSQLYMKYYNGSSWENESTGGTLISNDVAVIVNTIYFIGKDNKVYSKRTTHPSGSKGSLKVYSKNVAIFTHNGTYVQMLPEKNGQGFSDMRSAGNKIGAWESFTIIWEGYELYPKQLFDSTNVKIKNPNYYNKGCWTARKGYLEGDQCHDYHYNFNIRLLNHNNFDKRIDFGIARTPGNSTNVAFYSRGQKEYVMADFGGGGDFGMLVKSDHIKEWQTFRILLSE